MRCILLILLSFTAFQVSSQPVVEWQRSLGGSASEIAYSVQQTTDGGYVVAGVSYSDDGDLTANHGSADLWVVKLDASGNTTWQRNHGGTLADQANAIWQITDGGYIVAGYTESNNGDVSGNHGLFDIWIAKLNSSGDLVWQKCLGGSSMDIGHAVQQTADGGYVVTGYSQSNNGDVSGNHGFSDFWVAKLDATGNIQWQKSLGGSDLEVANSIIQTTDGGYMVTGVTSSNNGDVSGFLGSADYWLVKLNATGDILWQKCLGGSGHEVAKSIRQTNDGAYIIAGYSQSNDGDASGNHGDYDSWIARLDTAGNIQWQNSLGGSSSDPANAIRQTADGGFVAAGYTQSNNGDVLGNHGASDYWLVKLTASGGLEWQKCLGGTNNEAANAVQQTTDGGYIMTGYSESNNGDVSGNHGNYDFWVVKLKPPVEVVVSREIAACDSALVNGQLYYTSQVIKDTIPVASGDSIVITELTISSCDWDVICENTRAFASDGEMTDFFGRGMAVHGNKALVGAERDDDNGTDAGAVYAYEFNGTSWEETQKIVASTGGADDLFGWQIAMTENLAFISAFRDDDNGTEAGAVYCFEYQGGTWIETQKLLASDGAAGDLFGYELDLKGYQAVVSAPYDDDGFTSSGTAYIFNYDGNSWTETQKITASDANGEEFFGSWVSISSEFVLVGAPQDSDLEFRAGSAYFFRNVNGTWTEWQKVYGQTIVNSDLFGSRVALSGTHAFINAPGDDQLLNAAGAVYAFEFNGTSWNQIQKMYASDAEAGDFWGTGLAFSGDYAVITTSSDDDDGIQSGSAYLLAFNGSLWEEQQKFKPSDGAPSRYFGDRMDFSGDHIVVSAIGHDSLGTQAGAAYFFHPDNIVLKETVSISACDSSFVRGQWYTASQVIADTVSDIGIACADSVYITNLTIYPSYSMDIFQASCNPGDTGVVIANLQTQQLCDSVIITHTTLVDSAFVTFILPNDTVCSDVASLPLSGGQPAGGTYSGPGVAANTFFPQALPAGSYTLTYTYTDTASGCEDQATDDIQVEEQIVTFNLTQSTACVSETSVPLSGGNPLGGVYSGTAVSGNSFNPSAAGTGSHQITYTYTTPSGCVSSATDNFTVESDVTDPIAVCRNITVQLDAAGTASIVAADIDDGSSDACSNVFLAAAPAQFDCDNIGVVPSMLTVTDLSGNDTTCTSLVTVADTAGNCCVVQQIPVDAGWNIISSYVIPDLPDMDAVFTDIAGDIIILKNETGAVYLPGVFNQVGDWGIEEGYQVKASTSTTLEIGCTLADPQSTPVTLTTGWNIISYLRVIPMNIELALSGITSGIIIAKDENGKVFIPSVLNQIGNMQPGQGYQIKMANPATLIYPGN